MNRIFVDTSGWGNLIDTLQQFHAERKAIYLNAKQNGSRLITTNMPPDAKPFSDYAVNRV